MWIKTYLGSRLSYLDTDYVKCGVRRNKGGILIRFMIDDTIVYIYIILIDYIYMLSSYWRK